MNLNTRKTCIAAALAFAAAGAASSAMAATLLGGGSSLVGPSIQAEILKFGANTDSLTYVIASSGVGQTAFLQNLASAFGASVTGNVYFANSDAALSTAQITSYATSTLATTDGDGPLIQIPYITTAITIPYVAGPTASTDTFKGPPTTVAATPSLALSDDDLCGIFSGKLTNWNQVRNPDLATGNFSVNKTINVVYRSDSSGTSELLLRHLSQVCTTANTKTGITFVDSTTFTASFPSGVPTTFHAASGSGGVQAELITLKNAGTAGVGYLSPDWTNTFLAPSSTTASAQLTVASLVNSHITNSPLGKADIAPTFTQADNAVATTASTIPTGQQAAVNPANWVPAVGNPTLGYPVSGTSQIILSECYNNSASAVSSSLVKFLDFHYGDSGYKAVVQGNGFDVPTAYVMAIQTEILSNTAGFSPSLAINDSECPTTGGR
jgi:phosphate transport system substrate-binding protein